MGPSCELWEAKRRGIGVSGFEIIYFMVCKIPTVAAVGLCEVQGFHGSGDRQVGEALGFQGLQDSHWGCAVGL